MSVDRSRNLEILSHVSVAHLEKKTEIAAPRIA